MKIMFHRSLLVVGLAAIGIVATLFGVFGLPRFVLAATRIVPFVGVFAIPFLIAMYLILSLLLFLLFRLSKFFFLLSALYPNEEDLLLSFRTIRVTGIMISSLLYVYGLPAVYLVAEVDDAPGLILLGFILFSTPLLGASAMSLLERAFLFKRASSTV